MIARFVAFFLMGMLIAPLSAQTLLPATTLFQNVRIFDGQSGSVTAGQDRERFLTKKNRFDPAIQL
ncbi:hypothetical protein [Aeromonas popoffii]